MASSIRFEAHMETSKTRAAQFMQQPEPLNIRWAHELLSSSSVVQDAHHNTTIIGVMPSNDNPDPQFTDAESEAEEFLGELLPSDEPHDILIAEEIQSQDDMEEDGNTETSMLTYKGKDLTLIWELPVKETVASMSLFILINLLGYSQRWPFLRMLSIVCTPRIGSKYANQKFRADWFTEADL